MLQTFVVNWSFVGGSRGAYVIPPEKIPLFGPYIQYLFVLMIVLVIVALTTARLIERSRLGFGFATIRDDEMAAEASGVPTLEAQADRDHAVGRADGHGRRAVSPSTSATCSRTPPSICPTRSTRSPCR